MLKLYTAADIAEMTTLADEARALDAEFRELMAQVAVATEPYDNGTGLWAAYAAERPELAPLAAALDYDRVSLSPAPFQKLGPAVYVGGPVQPKQNAAEWRRLNNRTRRELAVLRKALAALPLEALSVNA